MQDLFPDIQSTGQAYSQSIQDQYDIERMLTGALTAKYTKDNPLIQERQRRVEDLLAAPEQAQLEFGQPRTVNLGGGQYPAPGQNPVGEQATVENVFFSPAQQRALVSQRLAARLAPITTLDDILLAQYGGGRNIISDVTKAYGAKTERRKAEFDIAKTLAELSIKAQPGANLSATERVIVGSSNAGLDLLDQFENEFVNTGVIKKTSPYGGAMTKLFQNYIPALRDDDLMAMQSRMGPIREQVVNIISGAQVSAQEAQRVMSWIPDISKDPDKNAQDLISLRRWMESKRNALLNQSSMQGGIRANRPSLSSFEE